MPSLGSLLLLALIFVTIGFIGGALVSLFWVERDHNQEKAPTAEPEEKSIASVKGADEVVSILRDQTSQQLILRVGKELYQNAAQLSDQKRSTFEKVAVHWLTWLRNSTEQLTEPLPRNEFILTPETESRLVQVTAATAQSGTEDKAALPDSQEKRIDYQKTEQPIKKSLSQTVVSSTFQEPKILGKEAEIVQPKSIVLQIDDVLQEMISRMADAPKGVRLTEDPKGGVIVGLALKNIWGLIWFQIYRYSTSSEARLLNGKRGQSINQSDNSPGRINIILASQFI